MIKNVNEITKRGEMKNMKNRVISRTEQKWDFVASPPIPLPALW